MNKKGQLEIAAIVLILITTIGAIKVISESGHIYVGDKTLNMYYDYKLCPEDVKNIKEGDQVVFNTKDEAKSFGYNLSNSFLISLDSDGLAPLVDILIVSPPRLTIDGTINVHSLGTSTTLTRIFPLLHSSERYVFTALSSVAP